MLFVGDEDQSGTFNVQEKSALLAGIVDVCVDMDAYIQSQVPLQYTRGSKNPYLKNICVDLSIQRLLEMGAGGVPESAENAAARSTRKLENIAKGVTTIPLLKFKRDQPTASAMVNHNLTGTQARIVNVD
jgi:hypothetical protein